jgi:hypothetical protein
MLSAIKRVHLVLNPVDMRKSYDGLLSASRNLGLDPYGGECVVFFSKNRRLLKAIIGDAKGIFLLCRRFEGSNLRSLGEFLNAADSFHTISYSQMLLLFEGYTFRLLAEARDWKQLPP